MQITRRRTDLTGVQQMAQKEESEDLRSRMSPPSSVKNGLTFIDLFCGCGGFSLGMLRAGFRCLAAIDNDARAVEVLKGNLPQVQHPLCEDLTQFHPEGLSELLGLDHVDVIVGGPPCQGFSTARQVDGSNHGLRLKQDPRRHLYREFLRYVDFFQPVVFVIENVPGLRSAAGGEYFTRVQAEARTLGRSNRKPGYRVHTQIEDATKLGVPQKRRRQLVIGVRNDLPAYFPADLRPPSRAMVGNVPRSSVTNQLQSSRDTPCLGMAIGDLPPLRAGNGAHDTKYDLSLRAVHLKRYGIHARNYLTRVLEVKATHRLLNHVARPHSQRDLSDFRKLKEGESSAVAMRRGVHFAFPYDKSSFKDRYTRQSNSRPCSTIVAHLSKDGLMFIHPSQVRSLTPREAARVQSFPDWFEFPEARTHAFRLIGNAVPPLVGEAVGASIRVFLKSQAEHGRPRAADEGRRGKPTRRRSSVADNSSLPPTIKVEALVRVLALDRGALRRLPDGDLLAAWRTTLGVLPHLHPQNARDHGEVIITGSDDLQLPSGLGRLLKQRHARSGWPTVLTELGREAWRRVESGQLEEGELYRPMGCATQLRTDVQRGGHE